VKWIGADGLLCRLPVATISAILLGPGTTITHAAMKACADSNTPVCWTGEDCMRFYAFGLAPNHDNNMPRFHAAAWADKKRRAEIARRMFRMRFPDVEVESRSIKELRGMGDSAYSKHLRVAGNVQPGSIKRSGTDVSFVLVENDQLLPVVYNGTEAPPDTFKDESQALADGRYGRDGVFHAKQLQAKCASKYAPKQPGQTTAAAPSMSN